MPHPSEPQHSDTWRPCVAGELAALQPMRRRWLARAAVAGAAAAVLVGIATIPLFISPDEVQPAVVNCREAKQLMPRYASGHLDRGVMTQVKHHLERCDHCRDAYENLRRGHSRFQPAVERRPCRRGVG